MMAATGPSAAGLRLTRRLPNPGIPGPRMPTVVQSMFSTWQSVARGIRYIRRYGDLFRIRVLIPRQRFDDTPWPLVASDFVFATSPALVQEVVEKTGSACLAGETRRFCTFFLGEQSLLVLDGAEASGERRQLLSLFTPARIAACQQIMQDAARASLARMPRKGRVALAPLFEELVATLALRLMFQDLEPASVHRLRTAFTSSLRSAGWSAPFLLFPSLNGNYGRWSPGGRMEAARARFAETIDAERRRRLRSGQLGEDLFGQLLRLEQDPDETGVASRVLARVLTIVGGMDTVAVALAWCSAYLLRQPEMLARVRDEARRVCDEARGDVPVPERCRSLGEAACLEAVRLHTPISILARIVAVPMTIGGYAISPGTVLVGAHSLMHRRPDLFPDPDTFRLERFLHDSGPPGAFVPFGGGGRRCLGYAIALPMMTTVLTELLRALDLEPVGASVPRMGRKWVMQAPRGPVMARMTPAS